MAGTIAPLPKLLHLIMIGATASGKGTLSKQIMNVHEHFVHISPGDILRLHIKLNTPVGQEAKAYVASGKLAPDELVVKSVFEEIKKATGRHWILDGFPRTRKQAEILHNVDGTCDDGEKDATGLPQNPVTGVLNLIVPDDIIIERIRNRWVHLPSGRIYNKGFQQPRVLWKDDVTGEDLVQRADDKPEIVKERLKIHVELTTPLLDFYRNHGIKVLELRTEKIDQIWPVVDAYLMKELRS